MRASANNFIKNMSTGFIVIIFLSLLMFWLRWLCSVYIIEDVLPESAKKVFLRPSRLVPEDIENEPNVTVHSSVTASFSLPNIETLGFIDYLIRNSSGGDDSNIYNSYMESSSNNGESLYFDKKIGQIVYQHYSKENSTSIIQNRNIGIETLYAGPEGISETPDNKLGRFLSPIADKLRHYSYRITIFDNNTRRFYTIDFNEKSIVKGPQLPKDDIHKPVQIGLLEKNLEIINLYFSDVMVPQNKGENSEDNQYSNTTLKSISVNVANLSTYPYLLVLDETGRIDILDKKRLEFVDFSDNTSLTEFKLPINRQSSLAYKVLPVAFNKDQKYNGMYIACVNRDGTAITLFVYDDKGHLVTIKTSGFKYYDNQGQEESIASNIAIHFNIAWGPALTVTKFLLESLHPPVLSFISYLTVNNVEASSGHRALFILPDSFIAMPGRFINYSFLESFGQFILLILPSLIISIPLASQIRKNAFLFGLSDNERLLWIILTASFGLAAYITFRLIRPKITLVTCENCGKTRRPDTDKCHHCKSSWQIPELTPPSWRVVDI